MRWTGEALPVAAVRGEIGRAPTGARLLLAGRQLVPTRERPLLMGILNATPDSFSDGGRYQGLEAQVARAHELAEAGADLIDVGGESGVTNRPPVSAEEEIGRVVPLVERLAAGGVTVSIDTWKPSVARAALDAGASLVNDFSGLHHAAIADACADAGAGLVLTHTRAKPKVKAFPVYDDVLADVRSLLAERLALALERGVREDAILVDPGFDLSKTPAQSVTVLRRLGELHTLGRPILLAVSRKDFVGAITGRPPRERLAGTLAAIDAGVDAGATMLRVHDVAQVVDFLAVRAALRGQRAVAPELRLVEGLRREAPIE